MDPETEHPKAREARLEAEAAAAARNGVSSGGPPPPSYSEPTTATSSSAPPNYSSEPHSLSQEVSTSMSSLSTGPLDETINVPMVMSTEKRSLKDFLKGRSGKVSQSVSVRKMTRGHYLKHYAKDAEGNYIGTEKPAPDAGLVFVPGKSTPEDLLAQVHKVAFGKEHYIGGFGGGVGAGAGAGMGMASFGGGA